MCSQRIGCRRGSTRTSSTRTCAAAVRLASQRMRRRRHRMQPCTASRLHAAQGVTQDTFQSGQSVPLEGVVARPVGWSGEPCSANLTSSEPNSSEQPPSSEPHGGGQTYLLGIFSVHTDVRFSCACTYRGPTDGHGPATHTGSCTPQLLGAPPLGDSQNISKEALSGRGCRRGVGTTTVSTTLSARC